MAEDRKSKKVLYVILAKGITHVYEDFVVELLEVAGIKFWKITGVSRLFPEIKNKRPMSGTYPMADTALLEWPEGDFEDELKRKRRKPEIVMDNVVPFKGSEDSK